MINSDHELQMKAYASFWNRYGINRAEFSSSNQLNLL